jgi:hypothetical protein
MADFVADLLAPQQQAVEESGPEEPEEEPDSFSVLDDLFDSIESSSVESANAGSEGLI